MINSINFHPHGTYLLSTSNDGKLKIWDLRKGQILYTLLGHQGPTTSASFSPGGDYFCSGGKDSQVMIWRGGLTNTPTEIITGVSQTKIETELFVTDKDKVDRLPMAEPPKKKPVAAAKARSITRPSTAKPAPPKVHSLVEEERQAARQSAVKIGDAFKSLKPEVQTTLDKIFSQVELVSGTLALLDKRLQFSENRMMEVMNHIKDQDVSVRPRLVQGYPQFNLSNNPLFSEDYIMRPNQMENLNINSGLSNESHQSPSAGTTHAPMYVSEAFRQQLGGEEYFRATNVFQEAEQ